MAKAQVILQINGSLTKIWSIIRDFAHVDNWVEDVKTIRITGSGIGAVRHLVLRDGSKADEKLLKLDDKNHIISYGSLDTELPFLDYVAVISVKAITSTHCEINWTSTFKPRGMNEEEAVNLLKENYPRYLQKVEELCQTK